MPEVTEAPLGLAEARECAAALLGRGPSRIEHFRPPVGGHDSWSFRVWEGAQPYLLKIMSPPEVPIGAYFHRRLREAGVPVPELVAFSPDGGPVEAACGVFEWVEGAPAEFDSHEAPPYDEAELGGILRTIHDLRHEQGAGRLDDFGGTSHGRWSDWVADLIEWAASACLRRRAFGSDVAGRLCALPDRFGEQIAAAPRALLHYGDIMHNGNLIVDPKRRRILAVVDFSDAIVGDPRLELAWFDVYFGAYGYFGRGFDLDRFYSAYGRRQDPGAPAERLNLCLVLATMLTYVDPESPRGRHHIALLQDIVAEMLP